MSETSQAVFTIGHSNHSVETLLALLRQHGIEVVADVRSSPYSRYTSQFNREALEAFLKVHGIRYVFLGQELGARSDDPDCYENGRVRYDRLAKTALFQSGLDRVRQGSQRYRIALVCAEKEPLECHRSLLVAKELVKRGLDLQHIHDDGRLETHDAAMDRLLDVVGLPKQDLFRSREELLAEALERQEQLIAYVDE